MSGMNENEVRFSRRTPRRNQRWPREAGAGLAEVIVAATVFGLIAAAITKFMGSQSSAMRRMNTIQDINSLNRMLKEMTQKPHLFYNTAINGSQQTFGPNWTPTGNNANYQASNANFFNCFRFGTNCTTTPANAVLPLTVFHPFNAAVPIAGPLTNPVFYSLGGSRCQTAPAACNVDQFPIMAVAGYVTAANAYRFYYCLARRSPTAGGKAFDTLSSTTTGLSTSCAGFNAGGLNATQTPVLRPMTNDYNPNNQVLSWASMRPCPAGQVMVGFQADQTPSCQAMAAVNVSCPPGQFQQGVNPNGTPRCGTLLNGPQSCPAGQIVVGTQANGLPLCGVPPSVNLPGTNCPPGYVVQSIGANGAGSCVAAVTGTQYMVCPAGQVSKGVAANGAIICQPPMVSQVYPIDTPGAGNGDCKSCNSGNPQFCGAVQGPYTMCFLSAQYQKSYGGETSSSGCRVVQSPAGMGAQYWRLQAEVCSNQNGIVCEMRCINF